MTTIGQNGVLKADIILPPISKQKEFYAFVKQVDKSEFVVIIQAIDFFAILFNKVTSSFNSGHKTDFCFR